MDVPAQAEWIFLFSAFLLYSGPQWIGWRPPTQVKAIFFTLSTDSNSNLFQKHPHRQARNNVHQPFRHPLTQSSWHIKLSFTVQEGGTLMIRSICPRQPLWHPEAQQGSLKTGVHGTELSSLEGYACFLHNVFLKNILVIHLCKPSNPVTQFTKSSRVHSGIP